MAAGRSLALPESRNDRSRSSKQIKTKRMRESRADATARNGSGREVSHEQRDATGRDSGPRESDRPDPAEHDRSRVRARLGTQSSVVETPTLNEPNDPNSAVELETTPRTTSATSSRSRPARVKSAKPRRVQRMFAIEEDLDKKLWLYAIHLGKDRSEVVNDLLRPIVASMVLYDSRDRRGSRSVEPIPERNADLESD